MEKLNRIFEKEKSNENEVEKGNRAIPIFRSHQIKVFRTIQIHWGIEKYSLIHIKKCNLIVSADIQGYIIAWNSTNLKKKFEMHTHDTDIFDLAFCEQNDFLIAASSIITIYKINKSGISRIMKLEVPSPKRILSISNSNFFVVCTKESVTIWKKNTMRISIQLEDELSLAETTGLYHYKSKDLLLLGNKKGILFVFDVKSNFKRIFSKKLGQCDVDLSIGANEKANLVFISKNSGILEFWKLNESNGLNYVSHSKVYIDTIYSYIPACVNNEDCVLIVGLSYEVIVQYLGGTFRHERILNRKYSVILPVPEKNIILLGNDVQRDLEVAGYP